MSVEIINGCLLAAFDKGDVDVVGHCVNTHGVMGSGIASKLKTKYPVLFDRYKRHCNGIQRRSDLLGSNYCTTVHRDGMREQDDEFCTNKDNWSGYIINMFAQLDFGTKTRQVNYGALASCLSDFAESRYAQGKRIGFPHGVCCGLAGGNWDIVLEMIEFYFKDHGVRIYKL